MSGTAFTPGPWEAVEATEHHGAYVTGPYGSDICDLYAMSNPASLSVRNGGTSKPVPFADAGANVHLIAAAPELYSGLRNVRDYFNHLVAGLRCYPEAKANVQDTLNAIEAEFAALAKARGEP